MYGLRELKFKIYNTVPQDLLVKQKLYFVPVNLDTIQIATFFLADSLDFVTDLRQRRVFC